MKTIGLIGGMSWESSLEYYRMINELVKLELGDLHSCKSIMYSVDFAEIELLQHNSQWEELSDIMIHAASSLEKAGADFIVICTNTMHKMADDVQNKISIPLLHIADTVSTEIVGMGLKKVALLGTRFTMEQDFYKGRIKDKYGIDVIVPNEEDKKVIHDVIYKELVKGIFKESSKKKYIEIIQKLIEQGAEGIILGCTEIPLLIKQQDVNIPIFDTASIHARAAVKYALEQ
jgi:aspartate racemase